MITTDLRVHVSTLKSVVASNIMHTLFCDGVDFTPSSIISAIERSGARLEEQIIFNELIIEVWLDTDIIDRQQISRAILLAAEHYKKKGHVLLGEPVLFSYNDIKDLIL